MLPPETPVPPLAYRSTEGAAEPAVSLAPYGGERPPAPDWFARALAAEPERSRVMVRDVEIELMAWGERGRPGILLVHGASAHADWWSFIAPFLAADYRVAAFSMSGAGGSGWRDAYSIEIFTEELLACARAAGLFEAGPPMIVGHSFGGFPTLKAGCLAGEELAGLVTLDSPVRPPDETRRRTPRDTPFRPYPTIGDALSRFRLFPSQPCDNPFLVDHVARAALKAADGGWIWGFDPSQMGRIVTDARSEYLAGVRCPLAVVRGEQSKSFEPELIEYMRRIAPAGTMFVSIPEAGHHVMLDQPMALVATLRTLAELWT